MAQDFSLLYPLVGIFGQGNFGSIDGDPPAAAMRYFVTGDARHGPRGPGPIGRISRRRRGRVAGGAVARRCDPHGQQVVRQRVHPTYRVYRRGTAIGDRHLNHPLLVCQANAAGAPPSSWKIIAELAPGDTLADTGASNSGRRRTVTLTASHPTLAEGSRTQRHTLPATLDADFAFLLGALTAEVHGDGGQDRGDQQPGDDADAFQATWALRLFPTCRLHTFLREPVGYGKKPFWQMQVVSQQVVAFLKALRWTA